MSTVMRLVCAVASAASFLFAQTPRFEVASVKRAAGCDFDRTINAGTVALRGLPLKPILMEAFKVRTEQIEGPSWLETDCFEITAKIPAGGSLDQLPAMLQALLAERFKMAAHKEDRQRPGYALVVDKDGPKFRQDSPYVNFMGRGRSGVVGIGANGHGRLKGIMTMVSLANYLSGRGYGPVRDETGLTGRYDVDLAWAPNREFEPFGGGPGAVWPAESTPDPGPDLFTALRESLGLKLERRDFPVQFVVIDHIERTPTEN